MTYRIVLGIPFVLVAWFTTGCAGCNDASGGHDAGGGDAALGDASTSGGAVDGSTKDGSTVDGSASDGAVTDAGADAGADGGLAAFCAGSGPIVLAAGAGGGSLCTGNVAQTTFRYAVCSCGQFAVSNTFTTDSFDSSAGAYSSAMPGHAGSFGTNGNVSLAAAANVGGSVWVYGPGGITASTAAGDLAALGDLRTNAKIDSKADVTVAGDAFVGGDLTAANLTVNGTLTQPSGAARTASGTSSVHATATAPVVTDEPCACGTDALVDVAGIVSSQATANDDVAAGFDASVLAGYAGPTTVELPCGRLYAPTVTGTGDLTLRVAHRTALFIGGDLEPQGAFTVEIVGGGELDLFVQGNLVSAQRIDLGSVDAPSRVRLYVGGNQPIALSGGAAFAGNVYAPHAAFTMSTAIEIYGSLFAASIVASDRLTVHYDEAILHAGDDCGPPPATCTSCVDCGNQACTASGDCGACVSDSDCCSPLVCQSGTCAPAVVIIY